MAPTVTSSLQTFVHSLTDIVAGLVQSVLAVLTAILALGQNMLGSVLQLGRSVVALALDLFRGAFGFVFANILGIAVLGGLYYLYTVRQQQQGGVGGVSKRK